MWEWLGSANTRHINKAMGHVNCFEETPPAQIDQLFVAQQQKVARNDASTTDWCFQTLNEDVLPQKMETPQDELWIHTAKHAEFNILWFYGFTHPWLLMIGARIDSVTCFGVCWSHQWNKPGKFAAAPVTGPYGSKCSTASSQTSPEVISSTAKSIKCGGRTQILQIYFGIIRTNVYSCFYL